MDGLTELAAPPEEPVSVEEAKLHCSYGWADQDGLFQTLVSAARGLCERYTGARLAPRAYRLRVPGWPRDPQGYHPQYGWGVVLPVEPVAEVTAVLAPGADLALAPVDGWTARLDRSPPVVFPPPAGWPVLPTVDGYAPGPEVLFTAGRGCPEEARQAILLLVGYWFENRGDCRDPSPSGMPEGAKRLLSLLDTGAYC